MTNPSLPQDYIEVQLLGTHDSCAPHNYPLAKVLESNEPAHIAMKIVFSDPSLYIEYPIKSPRVPHRACNGQYEVYFSFWPKGRFKLNSAKSQLVMPARDLVHSQSMLPGNRHLNQEKLQDLMPFFRYLFAHSQKFEPNLFCSKEQLQMDLKALLNNSRQPIAQQILKLSNQSFEVAEQRKKQCILKALLKKYLLNTEQQELNDYDTLQQLEHMATSGLSKPESTILPIIGGLELEILLRRISEIANNPVKYQYHIFSQNSATLTLNLLRLTTRNCRNSRLKQALHLPWYIRMFNAPVTPQSVFDYAAGISRALRDIHPAPLTTELHPTIAEPIANLHAKLWLPSSHSKSSEDEGTELLSTDFSARERKARGPGA